MKARLAAGILGIAFLCDAASLPQFVKKGDRHVLTVDGRPYLLLGAQVHNSSGWPAAFDNAVPQLKALHVNTVEVPVYWDDIEPRPGEWNFRSVDHIVQQARKNGLRVALLWFATWKNGVMDYAPGWVKKDVKRFPRMVNRAGEPVRVLSPHFPATRDADARAFAALMTHLKEIDDQHTVILVQVENEPGSLETVRDFSEAANKLFGGSVPDPLIQALKRRPGTWSEVFGGDADESFAAWHVASYVQEVAKAGKAANPLPLSVNVWLRERKNFMRAGEAYPSGGATSNMLNIWKAAAPSVDVIAPDIYVTDYVGYREVCESYRRPDNPLLIPETGGSTQFARYMFYAIADYGANGFAPFGVDRATGTLDERLGAMSDNFRLLGPAGQHIAGLQSEGKWKSAVEEDQITERLLDFDRYDVLVQFGMPRPSYGGLFASGTENRTGRAMIAQVSPDEFLVIGFDARVEFRPRDHARKAQFISAEEGRFENGEWIRHRGLNGDQTFFGLILPATGGITKATLMTY